MKTLLPLVLAAGLAAPAARAQNQPPIRPLGPVFATTKDTIGLVGHMRPLPGGRVLLNDVARRRVLLLDSTLAVVRVVADSTSATASAYGPRPGGLIAYKGDSTLFVDPASLSMLVIDGSGQIARVMSVPRPNEVTSLVSISFGTPAIDDAGRLVYRAFPAMNRMVRGPGGPGGPGGAQMAPPEIPDSAAVVRLDLATRTVDTAAFIRIPKVSMNVSRADDGTITMSQTVNPLPVVDDWAVTSDGRLAIVRGRDYRVDWVGSGGAPTATAKVPFDWQRLSDEDKVALIDSVKAQRERMTANGGGGATGPAGGAMMVLGAPGAGGAQAATVTTMTTVTREGAGGAPATTVSSGNVRANITFVAPSELPDYKPPFFAGAVRADAAGNLWVRTIPTKQVAGGSVYDVIDARGQLIDRVQIPANRDIRGFGPGGVVYLMSRGPGGTIVEAARVR